MCVGEKNKELAICPCVSVIPNSLYLLALNYLSDLSDLMKTVADLISTKTPETNRRDRADQAPVRSISTGLQPSDPWIHPLHVGDGSLDSSRESTESVYPGH